MSGKTILAIIALIVAVHVVVIYFLLMGGKPPETPAPAEPPAAAQSADAQPGLPPAPGASAAQGAVPGTAAAPPSVDGEHGPNFGKPFNFSGAVSGNIASIPASKDISAGILVDLDTHQVLWSKDARKALPIASMTKMMTTLIAYEDVLSARNGLTLDTQISVTRGATKIGGSQVYLDPKESFTLRQLLQAVAIKSANDAAYLVAEFIGQNDVHGFVQRMNSRAKELGMNNTRFNNPHGLPEKPSTADNVSSAEDMAVLTEHILEHKQLMDWASTWRTDFREPGSKGHMVIQNHNHLVPGSPEACPGVDGLKTGFINRSGFCITVTCKRGGKRLVAVLMGAPTRKGREDFMRKLLDWGYRRAANPSAPDDPAPAVKASAAKKAAGTATKAPAAKTTSTSKASDKGSSPARKPAKKSAASEDEKSSKKLKQQ